jgi:hypothetical protein
MSALTDALGDGAVVAKRNLIKIKRVPELLVFTTLQPIMFILLFAYIFGSAIDTGGVSYREFLIAGIFAQTVIFGATLTGAGLADDMKKGIIDRFRSLPMSRSAVLVGRTTSDVLNNVLVITVMSLTGLVVGWRIRTSFLEARGGLPAALLFAYAISWIMAWVGLIVPSVEVVQSAVVHRDLPAHLHRQHVRAVGAAAVGAADVRGVEPRLVGDAGGARAVRQPRAGPRRAGHLGAAEPGALHADLGRADPAGSCRWRSASTKRRPAAGVTCRFHHRHLLVVERHAQVAPLQAVRATCSDQARYSCSGQPG